MKTKEQSFFHALRAIARQAPTIRQGDYDDCVLHAFAQYAADELGRGILSYGDVASFSGKPDDHPLRAFWHGLDGDKMYEIEYAFEEADDENEYELSPILYGVVAAFQVIAKHLEIDDNYRYVRPLIKHIRKVNKEARNPATGGGVYIMNWAAFDGIAEAAEKAADGLNLALYELGSISESLAKKDPIIEKEIKGEGPISSVSVYVEDCLCEEIKGTIDWASPPIGGYKALEDIFYSGNKNESVEDQQKRLEIYEENPIDPEEIKAIAENISIEKKDFKIQ